MRKILISKIIAMSAIALILPSASASAQTPKLEGTYKDWASYSRDVGGDKSCYAITKAKTKSPSSVKHGDIYFMISNWRSGVAFEQPSFLASYPLNPNVAPEAKVGSSKTNFYIAENEAFIDSASDEKRLVKAMRGGATMSLSAQSKRGTRVSYTFSLSGVTAALAKTKAACQ